MGNLFGSAQPAPVVVPQVETPEADLSSEEDELRKRKRQLFFTQGGAAGEDLLEGDILSRENLFGN